MKHLLAIILILALFIPAQRPDKLTCRQYTNGQCECYTRNSRGTGQGWQSRPRAVCRLVNRR
jgi:hypothetical protein